jgi:hypothetical protein
MHLFCFAAFAGLLVAGCNSAKTASDANFTKAINEYLVKHGAACTVIGRQFPIDVPQSEQREQVESGQN